MAESDRVECCWVEVYSDETLQTSLKAGYVSNQGPLWVALAHYLPWDRCQEVYMCEPQMSGSESRKIWVYNEDTYRQYHAEEDFFDYVKARCARFDKEIFENWPKRMLIMIKRPEFDLCLQRASE
jgi:hypothetical protein